MSVNPSVLMPSPFITGTGTGELSLYVHSFIYYTMCVCVCPRLTVICLRVSTIKRVCSYAMYYVFGVSSFTVSAGETTAQQISVLDARS